jgi:hypothetical protein
MDSARAGCTGRRRRRSKGSVRAGCTLYREEEEEK